jgi:hypothetical protein
LRGGSLLGVIRGIDAERSALSMPPTPFEEKGAAIYRPGGNVIAVWSMGAAAP